MKQSPVFPTSHEAADAARKGTESFRVGLYRDVEFTVDTTAKMLRATMDGRTREWPLPKQRGNLIGRIAGAYSELREAA